MRFVKDIEIEVTFTKTERNGETPFFKINSIEFNTIIPARWFLMVETPMALFL